MYRPEGWKNPHSTTKRELRSCVMMMVANPAYYNFEAGADAMLEALKEQGLYFLRRPIEQEGNYVRFGEHTEWGWLIFIIDEEG